MKRLWSPAGAIDGNRSQMGRARFDPSEGLMRVASQFDEASFEEA